MTSGNNYLENLSSCNAFNRFLKVPSIIAFLFSVVGYCFLALNTLWLARDAHGAWYILVIVLCMVIYPLVIFETSKELNAMMIKKRLWHWGRHKFDSWEEFSFWIGKTHHLVLDHLAGCNDDSWEPNLKTGGIRNDR